MDYPEEACLFALLEAPGGTFGLFQAGDVVEFTGYYWADCVNIQPAYTRLRQRGYLDNDQGFLARKKFLLPLTPLARQVLEGL